MALTKAQRKNLFNMFGGKCAYCGYQLPERGWHADHIEPVLREWWKRHYKQGEWQLQNGRTVWVELPRPKVGVLRPENERLDNYFPSCRACNIDKHCMSLEVWRGVLEHKPNVLRDNYSAWRHAERFGLVAVVNTKVVFYFERMKGTDHAGNAGDEPPQCPALHTPDGEHDRE